MENDMADLSILQQRLARARAAVRDEKKRAKEREDQLILSTVRRSGLALVDLETLLANRVAPESIPEPVPESISAPADDGFWVGGDQQ
jgi:hypothetical protein